MMIDFQSIFLARINGNILHAVEGTIGSLHQIIVLIEFDRTMKFQLRLKYSAGTRKQHVAIGILIFNLKSRADIQIHPNTSNTLELESPHNF